MRLMVGSVFTVLGSPALGLALADIDLQLYSRDKGSGVIAAVWNTENPTEEIGCGMYGRQYNGADFEDFDYFACAEYTGVVVLDSNWSFQCAPMSLDIDSIWQYSQRTLTFSFASLRTALHGDRIEIDRGDTMILNINQLGDISTMTKLWFTVKDDKDLSDAQSIIQIEESVGLLYIVGVAAAVPGNGSITVTDALAGNITVRLEAVEAAKLPLIGRTLYDLQWLDNAGAIATFRIGDVSIIGDITREVD